MEIACTRSSHDLLLAKQAYHARFKKSMEEDIAYHTTEDFRKVRTNSYPKRTTPHHSYFLFAADVARNCHVSLRWKRSEHDLQKPKPKFC